MSSYKEPVTICWIILLGIVPRFAFSQEIDLQQLTDEVLSTQDDDLNYEQLYENTIQLFSSPVELNTATDDDLKSLHLLDNTQINHLIEWRARHGPLLDIHELQVIPGFDANTIHRILPFVKVVDPATRFGKSMFARMMKSGSTYFVARYERTLERKRGFDEPDPKRFLGSPDRLYTRVRSSSPGEYSFGFTGEKDEGEQIRFNPSSHQWGLDFTSFHMQVRNKGIVRNLIAGDFLAQFGQGLMFGGGFGAGKGGDEISLVRKAMMTFQPYTGIRESGYQRGIATTIDVSRHLELSLMWSRVRRDASEDEINSTITLLQTGLHRNQREIMKRKVISEQNSGVVIRFTKGWIDAGVMFNRIEFSAPLMARAALYNRFHLKGTDNTNAGLFLNIHRGNFSFFSEATKSTRHGIGVVAGVLFAIDRNMDFAMLYRRYDRDLHTFYSNAFAENTLPRNEEGLYWTWKYRFGSRINFVSYVDFFHFPWIDFRRYRPSFGYEWSLKTMYKPSRHVNAFIQIREESKDQNTTEASNVYKVSERLRRRYVVHFDYGINRIVRLKSRVQYNSQSFNSALTQGWLFSQDIGLKIGRFVISASHAIFDTEDFDNRHYVYEKDAWSAFSMPAYSGTGVRNYVLVEYKLSKKVTFWVRYSRIRMSLIGEIGSAEETIEGNRRNDVKFQARLIL